MRKVFERNICYVVFVVVLFCCQNVNAGALIVPIIKDVDRLDSLRMLYLLMPQALSEVTKKAGNRLTTKPYSVMDKKKTISGDKHNYESMAIYYWPDPKNPGGKYIVKDGQPNPEYAEYDGSKLFGLTYSCNDLTEAYYVTHDKKYLDRVLLLLNTWFIDEDTKMLPNMEYCQFLPGHNRHGMSGGISEAICFIDIVEDIAILYKMKVLPVKTEHALRAWFADFAEWLKDSSVGKNMSAQKDNTSINYDILLYRLSLYVGDKTTCTELYYEFPEKRLDKQFAADGTEPQELLRTRSYYYSIYNLQHVIDFCVMCEYNKQHFYRENQSRIDNAAKFLSQYIGKKDKYPYKEISPSWSDLENNMRLQNKRLALLRQKTR